MPRRRGSARETVRIASTILLRGAGLDRHPAWIDFLPARHNGRVGVDFPDLDAPVAEAEINPSVFQPGQPGKFAGFFSVCGKLSKNPASTATVSSLTRSGFFRGPFVAEQNVARDQRECRQRSSRNISGKRRCRSAQSQYSTSIKCFRSAGLRNFFCASTRFNSSREWSSGVAGPS